MASMIGPTCPKPQRLEDFVLGKLAAPDAKVIDVHLGSCASCQQQATTVDLQADPLVQRLRRLGPPPAALRVPPFASVLHTLYATTAPVVSRAELPNPSPDLPNQGQLGPYVLVKRIGQGGMGTIHEAIHWSSREVVAVKVLREGHGDAHWEARFKQEINAVEKVRHDHIVRYVASGHENGWRWFAMERLHGDNLQDILARHPSGLPLNVACEIVRQAALGLVHAHEAGLIHRDIKPSNLFLTRDGVVKILDLGLALLREPGASPLTKDMVLLGTPDYMAPEQYPDPHRVDAAADIYSLGCTLYALLTGRAPFHDRHGPTDKIEAHAKAAFPQPKPSNQCQEVVSLMNVMIDRDPMNRNRLGASRVAQRLAPFCGDASRLRAIVGTRPNQSTARPPSPAHSDPVRPPKRWLPWAAAGALLAVVCVLAWAATGWFHGSKPDPTPNGSQSSEGDSKAKDQNDKRQLPAEDDGPVGEVGPSMSGFGGGGIYAVRLSPKGDVAVTAEEFGPLRLWDIKKRKLQTSWAAGYSIAFAPNGEMVATTEGGQVHFSSPTNGKVAASFLCHTASGVSGNVIVVQDLQFSPDGKWLVTAGIYGGCARIWSVKTTKQHREFKHGANTYTACFTVDGKSVLSGANDKFVRLWDIENDVQLKSFEGHDHPLLLVRALADGQRFVSVSTAGEVIVWDLKSGKRVRGFLLNVAPRYFNVAVAAAGHRLLVAHPDASIAIWDLYKGEKLDTLTGHKGGIFALDVTPDGRHAVSAGVDRTLRYWRLPPLQDVERSLPKVIKKT